MSNTINKKQKKTILFDFDGVIHSYKSGWNGVDMAIDEPVKCIKECIDQLKEKYLIYIYSSRCSHIEGIKCIEEYLKEYNIYADKITNVKPAAYLTIDDRCICFDGNVYSLIDKIDNFIPWTRKTENIKPAYQFINEKGFFEVFEDVNIFDSINFESNEGKLLMAALSILTTSKFIYKGKDYDGTRKHPEEVCRILKELSDDIYKNKDDSNNDI